MLYLTVVGAAAWTGTPRLPSPRTLPPRLPGGSQGVPRPAGRHSHSSVSWVFLGVSSPAGHARNNSLGSCTGAFETDAWATSAGSSWCGGAVAVFRAPPGWQSSSPSISNGAPRHPADENHFSRLYPGSYSFGQDPKFMTTGEGRNVDWPVNQELHSLFTTTDQ